MVNDQCMEQCHWYLIHTADRFASIMIMVRSALARKDQISVAAHTPGRLLQAHLNFYRPYDAVTVYQQAWSTQYGLRQILSKCKQIWTLLKQCLEHLPQRNLVIVCGDFIIPCNRIPHLVYIMDPKYS